VETPVMPTPAINPTLVPSSGHAYFVAMNGNDANPGTLQLPWRTIAKANQELRAGNTVYIRGGTYDEVIEPYNSGTAANYITYTNYENEEVIIRGEPGEKQIIVLGYSFNGPTGGNSYIHINGIILHHGPDPTDKRFPWILINGSGSVHNIIRNCRIVRDGDPLQGYGNGYRDFGIIVDGAKYTVLENNYIRGVQFGIHVKERSQFTRIQSNYITETGQSAIDIGSSYGIMQGTLIEGNVLERSAMEDGIQFEPNYGSPNIISDISNLGTIIRNNVIRYNAENAIDLKGTAHVVIEGNVIYGTIGSNNGSYEGWNRNSHSTIMRGSSTSTRDVIIRNNVLYDNANGIELYQGYKVYNNTLVANNRDYTGSNSSWTNSSKPAFWGVYHKLGGAITGMAVKNNIIIGHNTAEVDMRLNQSSAHIDIDYNAYGGLNADLHIPTGFTMYALADWQRALQSAPGFVGNDAHSIFVSDPRFVNVPANPTGEHEQYDFRLSSVSPVIDRGGKLTIVVGSGSSRQIAVEDAGYFMDGFGVVTGDTVLIGTNIAVGIVSVDYSNNVITINTDITWKDGDAVSLPFNGSAPDIGANEFGGGS